jgi:hypothetical protein
MSDTDDPVPEALLRLGSAHPITSTSFDAAIATPITIGAPSRKQALSNVEQFLGTVMNGVKVAAISSSSSGVRLIFSSDTSSKVSSGEWHIPTDRKTGLPRAEARDRSGHIREQAKFESVESVPEKVTRHIVAAAHVISAVDVAIQLQTISEQITRLSEFMSADRRGELRGVYGSIQRGLADVDAERSFRTLEACALDLERLQGRFYETAKTALDALQDPEQMGILGRFKSPAKAKRELQEQVGQILGDLRLMEFCSMLAVEVQKELGNASALPIQQAALLDAYDAVLAPLTVKARYLDLRLAADVERKKEMVDATRRLLKAEGEPHG